MDAKSIAKLSIGIVVLLTATFVTAILLMTIFKLYTNKDKLKAVDRLSILSTFFGIVFHFVLGVLDIPLLYFYEISYDEKLSFLSLQSWYSVYFLCRLNVYFVYIYRLHSVFHQSAYNHSKHVYICVGIGCIFSASCTLAVPFFSDIFMMNEESNKQILFLLELSFGIMDFVMICILIFLFLKPIFALLRAMNESTKKTEIQMPETQTCVISNNSSSGSISSMQSMKKKISASWSKRKESHTVINEKLHKLVATATKLTVLMLVSMLSTFILQIMWATSVGLQHANYGMYMACYAWWIDTSINIVCLYLSYAFATDAYRLICKKGCKLHLCCLSCLKCCGNFE